MTTQGGSRVSCGSSRMSERKTHVSTSRRGAGCPARHDSQPSPLRLCMCPIYRPVCGDQYRDFSSISVVRTVQPLALVAFGGRRANHFETGACPAAGPRPGGLSRVWTAPEKHRHDWGQESCVSVFNTDTQTQSEARRFRSRHKPLRGPQEGKHHRHRSSIAPAIPRQRLAFISYGS